jgi:hypothetical protein
VVRICIHVELLYYSLLLVTNKGLLYLFIVTTQQDAFTHKKDKSLNLLLSVELRLVNLEEHDSDIS